MHFICTSIESRLIPTQTLSFVSPRLNNNYLFSFSALGPYLRFCVLFIFFGLFCLFVLFCFAYFCFFVCLFVLFVCFVVVLLLHWASHLV